MAIVYGVNKTLSRDPSGSNIQEPGQQEGKLRVMTDVYEAAALASGSIIEVGDKLPKGARVVEVKMTYDALGAAIIDVGDYEDDDRYMTDVDVSTAGVHRIENIDGVQYECDDTTPGDTSTDRQIILTTASASITGTIKIEIYYVWN